MLDGRGCDGEPGAPALRRAGLWIRAGVIAAALAATPAYAVAAPASGTVDLGQAPSPVSLPSIAGATAAIVAFVGDVNGDSQQDVAIGVPAAGGPQRSGAGYVYVVFGPLARQEPLDLANLSGRGYRLQGRPGGRTGAAITALGDYDADGYDDFAIGAPRARVARCGGCAAGIVYVVRGSANPVDVDLTKPPSSIISLLGVAAEDRTGSALAALGDARAGLIIGAPEADPAARDGAGSVYVLPGPLPAGGVLDLASLGPAGYRIDGASPGAQAGYAVSSLPDLSSDQAAEVVIGAPTEGDDHRSGAVYVSTARPVGSSVDLAVQDGSTLHFTSSPGEQLGWAVASIGDLNGDLRPDVAAGAPTAAPSGRPNAGRVYVAFGRAPDPLTISLGPDPANGVQLNGAAPGDAFGKTVLPAPDLDGDAVPDLLVGAPLADPLGRRSAGAVYELLGSAIRSGIDAALLGQAGVRMAGPRPGWQSGRSLALRAAAPPGARPSLLIGSERFQCKDCPKPEGTSPVALLDAATVAPPPPAIAAQVDGDCTRIRDIELIVDSSRSMRRGDPQGLRRAAIELLLTKPRSSEINLGVLAIRSTPTQVFPALRIGQQGFADEGELGVLRGLLDEYVSQDFGVSDYLLGLTVARLLRPGAGALILITDANDMFPAAAPVGPGQPPIYVLQLRSGLKTPAAPALEQLAKATGGEYYPDVDGNALAAVLNLLDARLNCERGLTSDVVGAPKQAAVPPPAAPAPGPSPGSVASTTLTAGKPASAFVSTLPDRFERATVSVSWKQTASGAAKTRGRPAARCLDASSVVMRTLRVYGAKRVLARANQRQLRAALAGRPTKIGVLRARGRCARGVLTMTLTGFARLRALPASRAAAATTSPSRLSIDVGLRGFRRHGGRRSERLRRIRTSYSASADWRRNR